MPVDALLDGELGAVESGGLLADPRVGANSGCAIAQSRLIAIVLRIEFSRICLLLLIVLPPVIITIVLHNTSPLLIPLPPAHTID